MKGSTRKKGDTWYYRFDLGIVDGKRKQKEKGGFKTQKAAEKAMREAMAEWENRGKIIENSSQSYTDYLNYWIENYVEINLKHNSIIDYKQMIRSRINPIIGNYKLKQLTPGVLQKFLNDLKKTYTKNYVFNIYGVLSGSLKYAVHPLQLLKENPMQYVHMPKYDSHMPTKDDLKIISKDDYFKILERYPFGSTFYIPCIIAWNTGLRVGEVCALTWDNIDFNDSTLTVNGTLINKNGTWVKDSPKTASSNRTIAIGDTLVKELKRWKAKQAENKLSLGNLYKKSNYICTREDGELITTDTTKVLSRVVNKSLGIRFNFHSFRHTHATMLIESGAPMKAIQERLGHSKMSTTADTYSHVTKSMEINTVNLFESFANN